MKDEYRIAKESLLDKSVVLCNCGTRIVYPTSCTEYPKMCFECAKIHVKKLKTPHRKLDSFCDTND